MRLTSISLETLPRGSRFGRGGWMRHRCTCEAPDQYQTGPIGTGCASSVPDRGVQCYARSVPGHVVGRYARSVPGMPWAVHREVGFGTWARSEATRRIWSGASGLSNTRTWYQHTTHFSTAVRIRSEMRVLVFDFAVWDEGVVLPQRRRRHTCLHRGASP